RGNSHAASRRRRRSDGGRSSPCQSTLEEFPPHKLLNSPGQLNPPVGGLVVLEQGYEDPGAGERRIVERVREPHLPVAAAVADVRSPRLPIVQRRAAVGLTILAEARNPALDVVHPVLAKAHVAGRGLDQL